MASSFAYAVPVCRKFDVSIFVDVETFDTISDNDVRTIYRVYVWGQVMTATL